ncbi:DUF4157 domain-containing protein [Paraburkholderia terrae]|uniref:eCIS core domain-containing protein n=1 Tax=Paraburkholderia terrae TaxID=311230 RepID=UPI001E586547|nr:DUF4157 domain-containing protein [Paraburkholderia terrae]
MTFPLTTSGRRDPAPARRTRRHESDPAEQEADRIAEWVTRWRAAADVAPDIPGVVPHALAERTCANESDGQLPKVGAGVPLDRSLRSRFEPIFGHSFRDVQVHTDAEADRSARSLGAMPG